MSAPHVEREASGSPPMGISANLLMAEERLDFFGSESAVTRDMPCPLGGHLVATNSTVCKGPLIYAFGLDSKAHQPRPEFEQYQRR